MNVGSRWLVGANLVALRFSLNAIIANQRMTSVEFAQGARSEAALVRVFDMRPDDVYRHPEQIRNGSGADRL